jgi:hypothetical protein
MASPSIVTRPWISPASAPRECARPISAASTGRQSRNPWPSVAARREQRFDLRGLLDALGDDAQAEAAREADDGIGRSRRRGGRWRRRPRRSGRS